MAWRFLLYALSSGVLLGLSWPATGSVTPLIFLAFVPLLMLNREMVLHNQPGRHFLWAWLAFLIWNIWTTYWLFMVTGSMATKLFSIVGPVLINSFFMALAWQLFHYSSRYLSESRAFIALLFYWIGYEYAHLNWELHWPWLELGNVFAPHTEWVQWYSVTGVHGGTLWVLFGNFLLYRWYRNYTSGRFHNPVHALFSGLGRITLIVLPLLWSLNMYRHYEEQGDEARVSVVQPNLDPYTEKFQVSFHEQLDRMIDLALSPPAGETDLVVFPETALQEPSRSYWRDNGTLGLVGLWENQITQSQSYRKLYEQMVHPYRLSIISGIDSDSLMPPAYPLSHITRKLRGTGRLYVSYNAALCITPDTFDIYHKSKLVPGVEIMPYAWLFKPLKGLAMDLGGTTGGLGSQPQPSVFRMTNPDICAAPAICYESVFGEYMTGFVRCGANLLTVVTNDGWWGVSAGHRQHWAYARLRAVETRRDVARAANTGISGFINQRGDVVKATDYGVMAVERSTVHLNETQTFYVQYGDFLGRNALFLAVLMAVYTLGIKVRKKTGRTGEGKTNAPPGE